MDPVNTSLVVLLLFHQLSHSSIASRISIMRRFQGRFTTNTASEAYQRQLAAPVYKWKKAWVSPSGLAPESSYKICKWVRVEKGEDDMDDAFSAAPEGDEDDEMAEDDAEDDDTKEAETPNNDTDTAAATPIAETPLETPEIEAPSTILPHAPAASSGLANPPITATTESAAQSDAATPAEVQTSASHALPSNAIELTNVAPAHAEEGRGDLGTADVGMEVHVPEPATRTEPATESPAQGDEDVVMEEEKGEIPVKTDAGLVHGEMDPPEPALAVEGGDHPPAEVEKES